jgi:hypothetical protein
MTDRNSASSCSLRQSSWIIFICLTMANASASDPGVPGESITVDPYDVSGRDRGRRKARTNQQDVMLLPLSDGAMFRFFS